jgi:hypothetical protein
MASEVLFNSQKSYKNAPENSAKIINCGIIKLNMSQISKFSPSTKLIEKEQIMRFSKFRSTMLLAIVLLLISSISVIAQDTVTFGEATELDYEAEPLVYSLEASAGQLIIVLMQSEDFDAFLAIEQDGNELATDDDSGGYPDALLAYVAQEDGSYDIVAKSYFADSDEGAFTLTIDVIDPESVNQGGSVTLEAGADGAMAMYSVFEAAAGDVVDVWAASATDEDVEVTLFGVDGGQIEADDDDGAGNNALIRRVVLNDDGLYLVKVEHSFSDTLLLEAVDVTIDSTEQLFLSTDPQELILGNAEGQKGTEVYTVDVSAGTTYRFIVTIESMPDDEGGIVMELLGTSFFFDPELEVQHSVGVTWDFLAAASSTIRLDIHPNFFGRDISSIDYTIAMEVIE